MGVRKPIVAGQFYPGNKQELIRQIEESFRHKFGPGKLPKLGKANRILGAVVPHAGYFFSGACAAHSYHAIAGAKKPGIFVLVGPNHSGMGSTSVSVQDWETPLGIAHVDKGFAESLGISTDPSSHRFEHSVEVQLPFLQYIYGDFRFVAISTNEASGIAEKIKKAADETGSNITLIASSDMTHYGTGYGYAPFHSNVKENIYKLDKGALDFVRKLDIIGFRQYLSETGSTMCGAGPVEIMMNFCKLANATKVKLLKYYTSGDIINDYDTAVGYASLVVMK